MTGEKPVWANAWHGEQVLKEEILSDLRDDLDHDRFDKGIYIEGVGGEEGFKGCHIGCLLMAKQRYNLRRKRPGAYLPPLRDVAEEVHDLAPDWHDKVPDELGMPNTIARFWDYMYEDLPRSLSPRWVLASLEAVEPGADLSLVLPQLILWMINDPQHGFLRTTVYPVSPAEEQVRARAEQFSEAWRMRMEYPGLPPVAGLQPDEVALLAALDKKPLHSNTLASVSPFTYLHAALLLVGGDASDAPCHYVTKTVMTAYAEAYGARALEIAEPTPAAFDFGDEDFDDIDIEDRARWLVAIKFFELCAAAPSQGAAQ